jgi:hypothetical protein
LEFWRIEDQQFNIKHLNIILIIANPIVTLSTVSLIWSPGPFGTVY